MAMMISLGLGAFAAWNGLLLWSIKFLLDRNATAFDSRIAEWSQRTQDVERDVLRLRADLPEKYVQRDDWIRFGAVIESKIDALRETVERVREKVYERK